MVERVDRARIELQPVKKDGFVFREKMQVVPQHDEIVFLNFGVGRIGVLHVDRALGERRVPDRVVDSAHVGHR